MPLEVIRCENFQVCKDMEKMFSDIQWNQMSRIGGNKGYITEFKAMYSTTGFYFLFFCEDEVLTSSFEKDGADLYLEDVLEIFLQPDERNPVYMEYEISPLNRELVLLVINNGKTFHGWLPFHYTGDRRSKHVTWTAQGEGGAGQSCKWWKAMVFLPFSLFEGAMVRMPKTGDVWKGNFFRIDYDRDDVSRYAFGTECGIEFHDYRKFVNIVFK